MLPKPKAIFDRSFKVSFSPQTSTQVIITYILEKSSERVTRSCGKKDGAGG